MSQQSHWSKTWFANATLKAVQTAALVQAQILSCELRAGRAVHS